LPRLIRTGVGSLPHADPVAAAEFVLRSTDVPYLPQLPNRHPEEAMLVQWGDGIAGLGAEGRRLELAHAVGDREQAFVGAAAVLDRWSGTRLKTQATGPVTLTAALRAGGAPEPGLLQLVADELTTRITAHISWIRSRIVLDELVVVLDEPALAAFGGERGPIPHEALEVLGRTLGDIDADTGIHCCGDTDWRAIASLRPGWLSWNLGELGPGFATGGEELAETLAAGTRIMWGMVPAARPPLPSENVLLGRYGTAVARLVVAGAPFEQLKTRAWFTPACGLAGLSVADAEAVTGLLESVVGEVDDGW
jgi:methionine synthase II (cobalamin-independent)